MAKKRFALKVPHTFVLIFCIILFVTLLTYIVPSGEFERTENETGALIIKENSFTYVDAPPVSPIRMLQSIPEGMTSAASIIFLIFIIGGSFAMINSTGAINAGIASLVTKLRNKEIILIPSAMLIFSIGGATFGMAESTLIFIPIGIVLARSLGMDALTGMAIVALGACAGFAGGAFNVFTVGVAQDIAGLPQFSGFGYRLIVQVIFVLIAAAYIIRYGRKVKKDPTASLVYDLEQEEVQENGLEMPKFNLRHKLILLVLLVGFGFIIYGVLKGWSTGTDLATIFLVMGIVSGFIGGHSSGKIADDFIEGAKSVIFGALIVGLARAIVLVLEEGVIIDTIINGAAGFLTSLPNYLGAVGMYYVQFVLNFFIPSGSGQAAASIPLMAPLGDLIGVTRQTVVLAFQLGDGMSNYLFPTSAILMAGLSIANIPYERWLKWVWPLMGLWVLAASLLMIIAVLMDYGPF